MTLLSGLVLLGSRLFWMRPWLAERVYAEHVGPEIARVLAGASGRVGFSIAEGLMLIAAGALVAVGLRALSDVLSGRRALAEAVAGALSGLLAAGSAVAALFVVLWGIHYARPPLMTRLGWTPEAVAAQDLAELCGSLVEATNGAYESAAGSRDLGRPSVLPADVAGLEGPLARGYGRVARNLGPTGAALGGARGPAKPVWLSLLMSHAGIAGFYFPWTGEANYNRMIPACEMPHNLAHEKAHQRGIAREDEAHFIGFLACVASDDPYARYSGYLFAQRQLLRELYKADRSAYKTVASKRDPGVVRDVVAEAAFWGRYHGIAADLGRGVNDAYLKAQGVREGIDSYSLSSRLLLTWFSLRGRSWDVAPAGPDA